MNCTSIRILSLAIGTFLCIGVVPACASEEPLKGIPDAAVAKPPSATPKCDPAYCPEFATGKGCCLENDKGCGADYGLGCVPYPTKKDGG